MSALDLFAGPGGWSEACRELGITEVGIEHDASACLTRAAAGHLTIRQDVTTLDTARFRPLDGLIASPPCPTFSAAGGRAGIAELRYLIEHVHACVTGWTPYEPPASLGKETCSVCHGEDIPCGPCGRVGWVPIRPDHRSALVLEPLRFALECVPQWIALEQVPDVLPVWEAYRFVLQAHGYSVWCGILNSADYGVPQTRRRAILMAHRRIEVSPPEPTHCEGGADTLLGELAPWISMAEALGWGAVERPCVTVTGGGVAAGGAEPLSHPQRFRESCDAWILDRRQTGAPTLDTSAVPAHRRSPHQPSLRAIWTLTRPATTVQGDPRLAPPGHRDREGGEAQFGTDALRLTETDALRLQSFRADYPVQGNKGQRFMQIGNAVPPKLARAILASLLPQGVPGEQGVSQ